MQTKHFFIVFERTDLTVKVSSLAKNLANLVSINIGTHGTGILKTWKTTLTLLMSSFSDCSLPTISSAGPPKSAYMLNTIYSLFLRFCFVIGPLRFLFLIVQMFVFDAQGSRNFFYLKPQILVFVVVLVPLPQAFVFYLRLKAFVFAFKSQAFVFV